MMRKITIVTIQLALITGEVGEAQDFCSETLRPMTEEHGGAHVLDWRHVEDPLQVDGPDKGEFVEGEIFGIVDASKRGPSIDDLLNAIKEVESKGNPLAIGDAGQSNGAYQIQWKYYEDARVQLAREHQPMAKPYNEAVHDDAESRRLIQAYWRRYAEKSLANKDLITLARIHNGGPAGAANPKTLAYWAMVKAVLLTKGFTIK